MKILLAADQYYPPTLGGSAISTRRLAHGLAERGHEVTVLAPSSTFRHGREQDGATTVVRCRSLPALHLINHVNKHQIRFALLPDRVVERTVQEVAPTIIHVQCPAYIGGIAARVGRAMGIPVVVTNHAMPDNLLGNKGSLAYKAIGGVFEDKFWESTVRFCDGCDFVLAPSNTACDMLRERGLTRQAVPLSNGVDLDVFHPPSSAQEQRALKERFRLPLDRPLVLYAGRLAAEKRLDVLVDAMPLLLAKRPVHFVFTGTGSSEIKERVRDRGVEEHVTFTGLLDDQTFPLIYRAVDVFAIPSEAELQGIVLLEAAASGLPLVGANAFAIPEIVHHGENGFLHQPGDPQDMADRLEAVLLDETIRHSMGMRSLELARHHDIGHCITQTESIYDTLLERRAAPSC